MLLHVRSHCVYAVTLRRSVRLDHEGAWRHVQRRLLPLRPCCYV